MSWILAIMLMVVGAMATIWLFGLLWKSGRVRGLGSLAALAVTVLVLCFLLFAGGRFTGGVVQVGPEHVGPTAWAIGLRIILLVLAMVLAGVVIGCLLALVWRLFAWLGEADPAGGAVNADERRRIMSMVEQGKMTGVEGAELLDALGKSSALRGQQTFGRLDIAILAAFLVTVLGFLLPWVRNSSEVAKMMAGMLSAADAVLTAAGYEIGAIGWITIISATIAALLIFITPKDYLYKFALLQMLCFSISLAAVISFWCRVGTNVMPGVIVCVIGLSCAIIASVMRLRALGR